MGLHKFASRNNLGTVVLALTLSMFAVGCKKKIPPAAPPPPPAPVAKPAPTPNAPVVSAFEAEPSTVERGRPRRCAGPCPEIPQASPSNPVSAP